MVQWRNGCRWIRCGVADSKLEGLDLTEAEVEAFATVLRGAGRDVEGFVMEAKNPGIDAVLRMMQQLFAAQAKVQQSQTTKG